MNEVPVFCAECGHQEVAADQAVVLVFWEDRSKYRFECPSCEEFRTNPAGDGKVMALVHAGVDVLVEPLDMTRFELAVVDWWGEIRW